MNLAAASARLCVETAERLMFVQGMAAAASARLCVETVIALLSNKSPKSSRLRAAVC